MVAVVVKNMKVWRLKKGYWCGALLYADYTVLLAKPGIIMVRME